MTLSERILDNVAWCREIAGKATERPWQVNKYCGIGNGLRGCETIIIDSSGWMDDAPGDSRLIVTAVNTSEATLAVMEAVAILPVGRCTGADADRINSGAEVQSRRHRLSIGLVVRNR